MPKSQVLKISFTPDPDDAFAWWAIATNRVRIPGHDIDVHPQHIQLSNAACVRGELDIAAVSSAAYPLFWRDYAMLDVGASVGRGYGPALVMRTNASLDAMCSVAVPGNETTGAMLFRLFFPGVPTIEMPCDHIARAISCGEISAGVLIHEELLNWEHKGLKRALCLGEKWQQLTGLPLPVGVIAVHRRLGADTIGRIATALHESILQANANREAAMQWALQYSCQAADGLAERFVDMFTNDDSLALDADCRRALTLLYSMAHEKKLIPEIPPIAPVEPLARERQVV